MATLDPKYQHKQRLREACCAYWVRWFKTQGKCILPGQNILITSNEGRGREWDENVVLEYVDDSHIMGITPAGVHVGIPMCFIVNVVPVVA